MTVYGTGSYAPNRKFAFPRRYCTQIAFGFGGVLSITGSGPSFVFQDSGDPNNRVHILMHPSLYGGRNYALTLDVVMVDWYLLYGTSTTPIPLNFGCQIDWTITPNKPTLSIWLAGFTTWYKFPLPYATGLSWLPSLPP